MLDIYKPTPTVFGDAANLAKWVIIGGAALFIVPKILKKWKGNNGSVQNQKSAFYAY